MLFPYVSPRLRLAAVGFGLLAVHCLAPTQVTLELTTDAVCADLQQTRITVGKLGELEGRAPTAVTEACDEDGRIGNLVLVPQERDQSFGVEVVVGVGQSVEACYESGFTGGCIVARRSVGFVRHKPIELPIALEVSCIDVPCGALQTCSKGQCISAEVENPLECALPEGCGDDLSIDGAGGDGTGDDDGSGGRADDGDGGARTTSDGGTSGNGGDDASGGEGSGASGSGGESSTGGQDGNGGESSPDSGGSGSGGAPALHVVDVTTTADIVNGDISSIAALVDEPGSDGEISLREAIIAANNTENDGAPDAIEFDIPGAGPHWIAVVDTALPPVLEAVILDATTQPGYVGTPVIELDGTSPTLSDGTENGIHLAMGSDGSTVRGFAVHGFPQDGILLEASGGHTIQNNYVGLHVDGASWSKDLGRHGISLQDSGNNTIGGLRDVSAQQRNVVGRATWQGIVLNGPLSSNNSVSGNRVGMTVSGFATARNLRNGIHVSNGASSNVIGGSTDAYRNLISGNWGSGVRINDNGSQGNVVQCNFIGSDAVFSGDSSFGNAGAGVFIAQGASNNLIGGASSSLGNWINFNGGDGVTVTSNGATGNAIIGNAIFQGNLADPIDLANDGLTENDPTDVDSGPNDLLNHPVLVATSYDNKTNSVTVDYELDVPAGTYRVEFHASADIHGTGRGIIDYPAGTQTVVHLGAGVEGYQTSFIANETDWISATTTEDLGSGLYGSTSEVSYATGTNSP